MYVARLLDVFHSIASELAQLGKPRTQFEVEWGFGDMAQGSAAIDIALSRKDMIDTMG